MPLPAALAARLAKRGILPKPRRCKYYYRIAIYIKSILYTNGELIWELSFKYHKLYFIPAEVLEEVFAENYDDQEDDSKYKSSFNKNDTKDGFAKDDKANFMVRIQFFLQFRPKEQIRSKFPNWK